MNPAIITEKKPWYRSKTLWFNAAVAGLAALEASANMIQPYLPGNVYGWGLLLLTVGNTVLRIVTTQGLPGESFHQAADPAARRQRVVLWRLFHGQVGRAGRRATAPTRRSAARHRPGRRHRRTRCRGVSRTGANQRAHTYRVPNHYPGGGKKCRRESCLSALRP